MTITNVYVANFFFIAVFGLLISAQWELVAGNGFGYTVFSSFGKKSHIHSETLTLANVRL